MQIILTKLTDERHRLSIERDDGSAESVELETRSYLLHDLVHYAVEAEAPIEDGVWGLLARGVTFAQLGGDVRQSFPRDVRQSFPRDVRQSFPRDVRQSFPRDVRQSFPREGPPPFSRGIGLAETLTGPMQSVWNGRLPVERYVENAPKGEGVTVDVDFVERVLSRLRRLSGAWRATPFRGRLVLDWPARGEPRVVGG